MTAGQRMGGGGNIDSLTLRCSVFSGLQGMLVAKHFAGHRHMLLQ